MPFPEISATESVLSGFHSHDQDSTDFSRAMSDLSLNNGNDSVHATSESSIYPDSISGLPRDRRSDHHLRAWDGNQEPQERLHDINRELLCDAGVTRLLFHTC